MHDRMHALHGTMGYGLHVAMTLWVGPSYRRGRVAADTGP